MNKSYKFILKSNLNEKNINFLFTNNDILALPVVNKKLELEKIITLRSFLLKKNVL